MAQYTILRASSHQGLDHVTERGESLTLCGRRTTKTWKRIGPILKGTELTLDHLWSTDGRKFGGCLTCFRAVRKLQRDGTEE